MKTLKSKIFSLIIMIMLTDNISYSYDVVMTEPTPCVDHFIFIHYPASLINCTFKALIRDPLDTEVLLFKVYVEQNGNEFFMGEGTGNAGEIINLPVNYQNFPGFCYNEKAAVRVDVKSYQHPVITYSGRGYFVAYREASACKNRAVLNGVAELLNTAFTPATFIYTCGGLATGSYFVKRTKIIFTLDGDFRDSVPVLQPSLCLGYSGASINNQKYWAKVLDSSDTRYRFYTFTYEVTNTLGQEFGNLPCHPAQAAIVYSYVKKQNGISPVIRNLEAFPRTLYTNTNVSYINCNLLQGNGTIQYFWRHSANPVRPVTLTPMGNKARLVVNYYNLDSDSAEHHIYVCAKAVNKFGESSWDSTSVFIRLYPNPLGCPNIITQINTDTLVENSILNESYANPGVNVKGNLLLENSFLFNDESVNFSIAESKNDITVLDYFSLNQVVVNFGEKIAVTDKGNVINYRNGSGKIKVVKNDSEDITDKLEFDDGKSAKLIKGDILNLTWSGGAGNNIILRAHENVNKEKPIGSVTINDGNKTELYSLDRISTECITSENIPITFVKLKVYQEFKLDMLTVVHNLNTFTERKLNLKSAIYGNSKDVREILNTADNKFIEITKLNDVKFEFENKPFDEGKTAYYVCKSNGQIKVSADQSLSNESNKVSLNKFNHLYENLPNPFNPLTKITYQIAKDAFVNLKVFDISGREVKTIVNEFKTTGAYEVKFDGSGISSGTYFYRIETSDGFKDTKRMILIK